MTVRILLGHVLDRLAELPADSVNCVVTSPPYWGLRDYGIPPQIWGANRDCQHQWGDEIVVKQGQFCRRCGAWAGAFGLEPTYQLYVDHAVEVFREVRRVLRPDGTLWLNLGDSYATGAGGVHKAEQSGKAGPRIKTTGPMSQPNRTPQPGLKPKDLCGIPWRVAFALQADGWWLRQDIIWSKPNPMPESVRDRPTCAHEYLFLFARSERYCYDADAIRERAETDALRRPYGSEGSWQLDGRPVEQRPNGKAPKIKVPGGWDIGEGAHGTIHRSGRTEAAYTTIGAKGDAKTFRGGGAYTRGRSFDNSAEVERDSHGNQPNVTFSRNKRSVWNVASEPFPEAHFATFPPRLIVPCILAGSPRGGTVLDPFGGAGTTGLVADRLGRDAILIELNPDYAAMARRRIERDGGMFADVDQVKTETATSNPKTNGSEAA